MKRIVTAIMAALALACAPKSEQKPSIVWVEVGANFAQYGNSEENIQADCKRIADMGFTHVVVEVRPTSGNVLFKSDVAPALTQVARWTPEGMRYFPRTADFDYLRAWIDHGHEVGLKVIAGVNMMVGGFKCEAGDIGMVYDTPERKSWCAVDLLPDGTLVNQADNGATVGGRFLDPANKEVQAFLLEVLKEVSAYKGLDGIVMDRCRYDDYAMDAGYTEAGRERFAEYIGREPERWPVFTDPGHIFLDKTPDTLENQWLTFRCKVIRDFVADCAETVHSVNRKLPLGIYVGAWFSEYYRSGVNWTSPKYNLAVEEPTYSWATPEYQATGFANLVDFMILGAYCPAANIHGDMEKTMEGYAKLGRKRLCGDVPFAAGPDIGNEKGFETGDKAAILPEIKRTMLQEADGFFLFDLCHIRAFNYWDAFKDE